MMRSTHLRMEAVADDTVHVFADPDDPAVKRSVRATLDIMKVPAEIVRSGEDFTITLRRAT